MTKKNNFLEIYSDNNENEMKIVLSQTNKFKTLRNEEKMAIIEHTIVALNNYLDMSPVVTIFTTDNDEMGAKVHESFIDMNPKLQEDFLKHGSSLLRRMACKIKDESINFYLN